MVRVWNGERGESDPEVYMATPSTFFQYMEERYGEVFPVYSGEWGGSGNGIKPAHRAQLPVFVGAGTPTCGGSPSALLGKDTPEARAELERVQTLYFSLLSTPGC